MSFVVIEGLDGSGKSTQIHKMLKYFELRKIEYQYLHFPRTSAPVYGELIARFLRGEFGPLDSVHPYLVALLYAGDRMDAAGIINQWLNDKKLVLVDRYVYSNIAFQCAKLSDPEERKGLAAWIRNLEYSHYGIPVPDLSIFLDVPFEFTRAQLEKGRNGSDRGYLNGGEDIHEADLEFQQKVREVYLQEVHTDPLFIRIDCSRNGKDILQPEEIFQKILALLKQKNIIG